MTKLNLVVEDAPKITRNVPLKNADLYAEVVELFNSLPLGKAFVIDNEQLPAATVQTKIRKMITLKEGEHLRLTCIKKDGKITGIRLAKVVAPQPKPKSEPQGEEEGAE